MGSGLDKGGNECNITRSLEYWTEELFIVEVFLIL